MSTQVLQLVQLQLARIGLPICILVGNASSFLGLMVLFQPKLRKNSCILFLLGYIITNLIYLNFTVFLVALSGYGYDLTHQSTVFCRLRMYFSFVFSTTPSYLLVMASWDRMCISSSSIRTRLIASRRFSLFMILVLCIFWSIFHIHAIIASEIQPISSTRVTCNTRPGVMTTFVTYYSLICDGIIPLLLMTIFGIRTWINVQHVNRNRTQRRERRIIFLLILQLILYFCLRLPTPLYFIYQEATNSNNKTTDRIIIDRFILFIVLFFQFIQVSVSPVLNLLTNTFRIEIRRIFYKIFYRNMLSNHQPTHNAMALSILNHQEHLNTVHSIHPA